MNAAYNNSTIEELRAKATCLGVEPVGDKRKKQSWIDALIQFDLEVEHQEIATQELINSIKEKAKENLEQEKLEPAINQGCPATVALLALVVVAVFIAAGAMIGKLVADYCGLFSDYYLGFADRKGAESYQAIKKYLGVESVSMG